MSSVATGDGPNSAVPITDGYKLTDATEIYLLPMNADEVDPNHRFDRDGTIAFINDVSNATQRRLLNAASTLSSVSPLVSGTWTDTTPSNALFHIVLSAKYRAAVSFRVTNAG